MFAYPWILWLAGLLPGLALLLLWAWRRRRQALARLGPLPVLVLVRPGPRLGRALCLLAGLGLLVVGAAGPQWEMDTRPEARSGPTRDLVIVLDLSRSMLAEKPPRQELAQRGLADLCAHLKQRGGVRVALVVFAGRPKVIFPLTSDYDHLAEAAEQQDADNVPRELHPDPAQGQLSGTRIGAALSQAVLAHDFAMQGAQEILLISDGDDPVPDNEWRTGVELARERKIPIHTIGVGTPGEPSWIPLDDDYVRDDKGEKIASALREPLLQEIARQTRGVYVPAHTKALPLGRIFQDIVASRPAREADAAGQAGAWPVYRPRYAWFLAGALLLLAAAVAIPDRGSIGVVGRASARSSSQNGLKPALRTPISLALIPLALLLTSAAPPAAVDDLVRQGNAAFAEDRLEEAVISYTQAESTAADPGLVAFNKAACRVRQGKYSEAAELYRRCLEDQAIGPLREARAWFSLGNCLARQETAASLQAALAAYRRCLALAETPAALRADAAHNLEVVKLLWLKAQAEKKDTPKNGDSQPSPKKDNTGKRDPKKIKGQPDKDGPDKGLDKTDNGLEASDPTHKDIDHGQLYSLPDKDELLPLPPRATEELLKQAVQRIRKDQRQWRRLSRPLSGKVKDW